MARKHNLSFIVSIHQPNIEVLDIFDNLYVLSKGGVNVYSGPPQSLLQHLHNCHIDCDENEIPIERLLKICANDYTHQSIIDLKEATLIMQESYVEQVTNQMNIICNMKSNWQAKYSLLPIWYLFQRTILLYYHTLHILLLFLILLFAGMALYLLLIYQFTPSQYRDCQSHNSTNICTEFFETMSDYKNVKYEHNFLFSIIVSPFVIIGLWTTLVFSSHINVFFWEHKNGQSFTSK